MNNYYAIKPCIRESFFGSVLSSGIALVSGHFALIPITAKFITNFTFCVKDNYSERLWNETKKKLRSPSIPNTNIKDFRDTLLSVNHGKLRNNRWSEPYFVHNQLTNICI